MSGDYKHDLNRENPLGTGGELATQFADLLQEMFLVTTTQQQQQQNAVYPRSFKYTLGKHAEQFMGYDQHDSQELATYLLDALHEDTNRVTKKPYIEKPEQKPNEPDFVSSKKAWELHLQREDSRVLENFMGQVKSRVQCPKEGCGRVSTTFDPFMYLSVPIPGASDRTLEVRMVPLRLPGEAASSAYTMRITVSKTGKMSSLLKQVALEWFRFSGGQEIDLADLVAVDVWSHEIYSMYAMDDDIDRIRDNDKTFIYQLTPLSEFENSDPVNNETAAVLSIEDANKKILSQITGVTIPNGGERFPKPSLSVLTALNAQWKEDLDDFCRSPTTTAMLFNPKRGTMEDRIRFLERLVVFLCKCVNSRPKYDLNLSDNDDDDEEEDGRETLNEISRSSTTFQISTDEDVAKLLFIAKKFQASLLDLQKVLSSKPQKKEFFVISIYFQQKGTQGTHYRSNADRSFTDPICIRIPSTMTVYQLREELAKRLPVKYVSPRSAAHPPSNNSEDDENMKEESSGSSSSSDSINGDNRKPHNDDFVVPVHAAAENGGTDDASKLLVMRQVPLTFERKSNTRYNTTSVGRQLGMLDKNDDNNSSADDNDDGEQEQPIPLANPEDEKEKENVSELLGHGGIVNIHWPSDMAAETFDLVQHEQCQAMTQKQEQPTAEAAAAITVKTCIEKYCQMEQLEETEMWYCSKCKEHVRAWKQFHIYRSPPILIVHLKRFHYSASTHRRDKIDAFIDFPLEGLDLRQEVMHWTDQEKPIYDCYAVSNHYGGLGGGHYTAYAQSEDGVWCHFDDSRVSTNIEPKEVISSAAYVLYYKRRDVVFERRTPDDFPVPAIVQDHMATTNSSGSPSSSVMGMDIDSTNNNLIMSKESSPMGSVTNVGDDGNETEYEYEDDDMPPQ